jgi:ATP-dependent 26S proteasome regulatory subunit
MANGDGNSSAIPLTVESDGLIATLRQLDRMLSDALDRAREAFGPEAMQDRFRGLYIGDGDLDRLLSRSPAGSPLFSPPSEARDAFSSRLIWLSETFDLSAFDQDVLLLGLAPDVDLRYERLYAYLQDDVTRKRPTVDLALNLFCPTVEARLASMARFSSDAPLLRHRLLHLAPDPSAIRPPLLAHYLSVDEQILNFLLGLTALDRRLVPYARLHRAHQHWTLPAEREVRTIASALEHAAADEQSSRLYLRGSPGSGRLRAALAAASRASKGVLELSAVSLPADGEGMERILALAAREAWFQDSVLYVADADVLFGLDHAAQQARLLSVLESFAGVVILAGKEPWIPGTMGLTRVIPVHFGVPPVGLRATIWDEALRSAGSDPDHDVVAALASRFRFNRRQIAEAVSTAVSRSNGRSLENGRPAEVELSRADLFSAARQQSGHTLASLATRLDPHYRWNDLVLPESSLEQLHELCQRVVHQHQVLQVWGFGAWLSRGKGVNALFSGPAGTGKTMAAEVVAAELGLDLFRVELAGVVSKYIGETEKNLDRIFEAASATDGIVFFDEADALFGKRSEVRDSHDRYANIEISYLLQKMEEYEGVAILSTNLRGNLDQAFVRRLAFTVHFPFPDEQSRRAIWQRAWPRETPLGADLDLDFLAGQFLLSGGNIKNVALAAAFLAAGAGEAVGRKHVLQAVRREYEKVGKTLTGEELGVVEPH